MRAGFCILLAYVVACGARTGLLVPEQGEMEAPDAVATSGSGGSGSGEGPDSGEGFDALPPIDVTVPHDALSDCPNASATLIYVVTGDSSNELLSFYPPAAQFKRIGTLDCPATSTPMTATPAPFSMAVDHSGVAYVVYDTGDLFRVSTATASCRPTGFVSKQKGFTPTFGMAFSQDTTDPGETLFVASSGQDTSTSQLATIDTNAFTLDLVANFSPIIQSPELTGTGGGDLFAFFGFDGGQSCNSAAQTCPDSAIAQIDKRTGKVTNQSVLTGLSQGGAWAFAFWGGDFYTFTQPNRGNTPTLVTRFRPSDGSLVQVATLSAPVVGAGVSTCAPVQ